MGMELLEHTHIGVHPFRHLELKRDPFPDILGPHIGGKVRGSRPSGHECHQNAMGKRCFADVIADVIADVTQGAYLSC